VHGVLLQGIYLIEFLFFFFLSIVVFFFFLTFFLAVISQAPFGFLRWIEGLISYLLEMHVFQCLPSTTGEIICELANFLFETNVIHKIFYCDLFSTVFVLQDCIFMSESLLPPSLTTSPNARETHWCVHYSDLLSLF